MVKPAWRQLELAELDERDLNILMMKWHGYELKEIADSVKLSPVTLVQYMGTGKNGRLANAYKEFQVKMLEASKEEALNKIRGSASIAVDTLVQASKGTIKRSTAMSRIKASEALLRLIAPDLASNAKVAINNSHITFKWMEDKPVKRAKVIEVPKIEDKHE
jgi:hypothetical protein